MPRDRFLARFAAWLQGPQTGPSSAKKRQAKLLERQKEIEQRWKTLSQSYESRIKALTKRITSLDEATCLREASAFASAQNAIMNVLRRGELAEQETRTLINEWRDWERMAAYSDVAHAERDERQELLRSELALRGVEVSKRRGTFEPEGVMNHAPTISVGAQFIAPSPSVSETMDDHLEDWDEICQTIVPETVAYWNDRVKDIQDTSDSATPEALYAMMQRFRAAQGEQRLLDRRSGQRRENRLEAFG